MAKRKITIVATKVGDKMIAAPLGGPAKGGTNVDLSAYAKRVTRTRSTTLPILSDASRKSPRTAN